VSEPKELSKATSTEKPVDFNMEDINIVELIENIRIAIGISQKGIHYYGNRAYLKMFGFETNEQLVGKPVTDLIAANEQTEFLKRLTQQTDLYAQERYRTQGLRRDGQTFLLDVLFGNMQIKDSSFSVVSITEITNNNADERTIKASKIILDAIKNSSSHLIWAVDPKTHCLTFYIKGLEAYFRNNRGIEIKRGMGPEELFNSETFARTWHDLYDTALKKGPFMAAYESIAGPINMDLYFMELGLDDENTGIVVLGENISARLESDKQLRESREQFRVLSENANIGVYMSRDGKVSYANGTLKQMFGYVGDELVGTEVKNLIHSRSQEVFDDLLRRLSANGLNKVECELWGLSKDGTSGYLDIAVSETTFDNKIVHIGVIRDITDKRKAFMALRESEEFFRNAFDNASMGAVFTALDGKFIRVNEFFCEMTGYTEQELGTMAFNDITYDEDKNIESENLEKLIEGEIDKAGFEKIYVHKSGRLIWCLVSIGFVRNAEDEPLYAVTYIQDITEQKRNTLAIQASNLQLQTAATEAIECLGYVVETRDLYTSGHQKRVASLATAIATLLELGKEQINAVRIAGLVHDIGKMSIPAEILSKPTLLTPFERKYVEQHAESGYQILSRIQFPWPIAHIVHQHHERLDGSGYPRKLKSEDIMIEAKILAVADVVEAMMSHRPYRAALGIEAAIDEITRYRGVKFDSSVVDACIALFREHKFEFPE
jgi:PAS domain S-box-containing protein/putative nucleotidyltransferase with HDIG domain